MCSSDLSKEAVTAATFTKLSRATFKGTRSIPFSVLAQALGVKPSYAHPYDTYDPLAGLEGHARDTMRVTLLLQLDQLDQLATTLKEQARHLITKIENHRDHTIQDEAKQPRKFQSAKAAALNLIQKAKNAGTQLQRLAEIGRAHV